MQVIGISQSTLSVPVSDSGKALRRVRSLTATFNSQAEYRRTVVKAGTGDLSVSIGGVGGGDFSVPGSTNITVKPKKSYKLSITFKPTSTGDKTATLVLNSNDPDAKTTRISLIGRGM